MMPYGIQRKHTFIAKCNWVNADMFFVEFIFYCCKYNSEFFKIKK